MELDIRTEYDDHRKLDRATILNMLGKSNHLRTFVDWQAEERNFLVALTVFNNRQLTIEWEQAYNSIPLPSLQTL